MSGKQQQRFSAAEIPSLQGLTAIVTGGNGGIGKETVKQLALHGAKVYMASRSLEKGEAAIDEIKKGAGGQNLDIQFLKVDLDSIKSVQDAAKDFKNRESKLDILVCNAGLMACPYEKTADGVEIQFQTNYLGHWTLASELHDALKAGHQARNDGKVSRVVFLSSLAHTIVHYTPFAKVNYSSLDGINQGFWPEWTQMGTWLRYSQAKLAAIHNAREINRRWVDDGIRAAAVHPGMIDSELWKYTPGKSFLRKHYLQPVSDGALSPLYAATSPEIEDEGSWDVYRAEFGHKSWQTPESKDDKLAKQLWEVSEAIVRQKTVA